MKFFRRLKVKYGIAHPFCMLSLVACLFLCVGIILQAPAGYDNAVSSEAGRISQSVDKGQVMAFLDEIFNTVIRSYSQVVAIGIEPFFAVIVQGVMGLFNAMIGMPLDLEVTFFSLPQVLLIAVAVYGIGKLMQCFECTRSFAMLTYGEFERIFGYLMLIYITCQNVMRIMYVCEKHKSMLEVALQGLPIELMVGLFVLAVGVASSFGGILIFYIIKTLVLGLQIMQLSVSFFPFTSLLFEVLRSCLTIAVAVFNLLFPMVGFAFNIVAFVIGIILLAQTSNSVEYFRVIYIETMLLPYYRFKGEIGQLYKDVPFEIRRRCKGQGGIMIPVFSMDKFMLGDIEVADHEKWWMEITEDCIHFYRKKFLSAKIDNYSMKLSEKNWYYKDNWRCLELFDLNGPQENIIKLFKKPQREIAFAFSREYEDIFTTVTESMGAVDYNALKEQLTMERKKYIEQENKAFYAAIQ